MSTPSFNFNNMINGLTQQVNTVNQYMALLSSSATSGVNLATMFQMQYHMQTLSQYMEAMSNVLSAVNTEMVSMARAVKGQ